MSRFTFAGFERLRASADAIVGATDAEKFTILKAQLAMFFAGADTQTLHGEATISRVAEAVEAFAFNTSFATSQQELFDLCTRVLAANVHVRTSHLTTDPGAAAAAPAVALAIPAADAALTADQANSAHAACPLRAANPAAALRGILTGLGGGIDADAANRVIAALAEDSSFDTAHPDSAAMRIAFYRLKAMTKAQVREFHAALAPTRDGLLTVEEPAPAAGTVVQWSRTQFFSDAELDALVTEAGRTPNQRDKNRQLGRFLQICVVRLSLPAKEATALQRAMRVYIAQPGTDASTVLPDRLRALQDLNASGSLLAELRVAGATEGNLRAAVALAEVNHLIRRAQQDINGLPAVAIAGNEFRIHTRLRELERDLTALAVRHPHTKPCVDAALERMRTEVASEQVFSQGYTSGSSRGNWVGRTAALDGLTAGQALERLSGVMQAAQAVVVSANETDAARQRAAGHLTRVEPASVDVTAGAAAAADAELRARIPTLTDSQCEALRETLLMPAAIAGAAGLGAAAPASHTWRLEPTRAHIVAEGSPLSLRHTVGANFDVAEIRNLDDGNGGIFTIAAQAGNSNLQAYYTYAKAAIDAQAHLSEAQKARHLRQAMRTALEAMLAANPDIETEFKRQFEEDGQLPVFLPFSDAPADKDAAKLWYQVCSQHVLGQVESAGWRSTVFTRHGSGSSATVSRQLAARFASEFRGSEGVQLHTVGATNQLQVRVYPDRTPGSPARTTLNIRPPKAGFPGSVHAQAAGLSAHEAADMVRAARTMGLDKPPIRATTQEDFCALMDAAKKLGFELSLDREDPNYALHTEWLMEWRAAQSGWFGAANGGVRMEESTNPAYSRSYGDVATILSAREEYLQDMQRIANQLGAALTAADAAAPRGHGQPTNFADLLALPGEIDATHPVVTHITTHGGDAALGTSAAVVAALERYAVSYDEFQGCDQALQRLYGNAGGAAPAAARPVAPADAAGASPFRRYRQDNADALADLGLAAGGG